MPTKKNTIKKSIAPKSLFEDMSSVVNSTISFAQGDLLVFNTSTKLLNSITVSASAEYGVNFVGVARTSISSGQPISPYSSTDNAEAISAPAMAGPVYGVTAMAICKTSDAFTPGCLVYPDGADGARYVTSTAGLKSAIGVYQGPNIASAAAGQEIEVLFGSQYPNGGTILLF